MEFAIADFDKIGGHGLATVPAEVHDPVGVAFQTEEFLSLSADDKVLKVEAGVAIHAVEAGNVALVVAVPVELKEKNRLVGEDFAHQALLLRHLEKC